MKTKLIRTLGLLLVALLGMAAALAPSEPKLTTREVMKQKLDCSQKVLAGIATENFAEIALNAQKLATLSQASGWQARPTPEYKQFTAEFRRHAEALQKAAKEENVDAASVAWFQLTISCVNCHRHMRGVKTVALPLRDERVFARNN